MNQPILWNVHRRRTPAHLSVSLRHDNSSRSSGSGRILDARHGRTADVHGKSGSGRPVLPAKYPSKESDDSGDSNARKWFDRSNTYPVDAGDRSFEDNEPPFFQSQDSSSSYNNAIGSSSSNYYPLHAENPAVVPSPAYGSGSDGYRSVIDDLTIENRKLKEKLRKYETSYSARIEKDKLFEVKVHALPAYKKREFKELLRDFVSNIDGSDSISSASRTSQKASHLQSCPTFKCGPCSGFESKNPSSCYTTISRPINSDSAYASMSTGPNSSSLNHAFLKGTNGHQTQLGKELKVESFLHTIPKEWLPSRPSIMTTKQKKKEVVRRLEQLFTGKSEGLVNDHSQPLQQQEVSHLAARADQAAKKAPAMMEGVREAYILQKSAFESRGPAEIAHGSIDGTSSRYQSDSAPCTAHSSVSPEQRPTRPLDLDPDRQQIPSDNVQYIRHLGLSTPKLHTENSSDVETDAEGWIYLNLLTNMAQLHIMNVTLDFVRSAVSEVSEKFQLSKDGRKIRWRGGTEGTRLSSLNSELEDVYQNDPPWDNVCLDEHSRKRRKVDPGLGQDVAHATTGTHHEQEACEKLHVNAFRYKPLGIFHHQSATEEDSMSIDESSLRETDNIGTGYASRDHKTWDQIPRAGYPQRNRDRGSIVFYGRAPFYVDLCGDLENTLAPQQTTDSAQNILGCKQATMACKPSLSAKTQYTTGQNFLKAAQACPKTPDQFVTGGSMEMDFSPSWASNDSSGFSRLQGLPASGLGGTQPADHFAIQVKTRRTKLSNSSRPQPDASSTAWSQRLIQKTRKSLFDRFKDSQDQTESIVSRLSGLMTTSPPTHSSSGKDMPVKIEIISVTKPYQLRPSALPAPMYLGFSTSSDDDSEYTSSQSSQLRYCPHIQNSSAPISNSMSDAKVTLHEVLNGAEDDDLESEDEDMDDSNSSIDMLAPARELDPETIAIEEEEFETQAMKRVLEAIPAGSSAANADRGSEISSGDLTTCTSGSF